MHLGALLKDSEQPLTNRLNSNLILAWPGKAKGPGEVTPSLKERSLLGWARRAPLGNNAKTLSGTGVHSGSLGGRVLHEYVFFVLIHVDKIFYQYNEHA